MVPLQISLYPASPFLQWVAWYHFPTFPIYINNSADPRYYDPLRLLNALLVLVRLSLLTRYPALLYLLCFHLLDGLDNIAEQQCIAWRRLGKALSYLPCFSQGSFQLSRVPELPL